MASIQRLIDDLDELLYEAEDACRDLRSNPETRYGPAGVADHAVLRDVVVTVAHLCDLLDEKRRTIERYVRDTVS